MAARRTGDCSGQGGSPLGWAFWLPCERIGTGEGGCEPDSFLVSFGQLEPSVPVPQGSVVLLPRGAASLGCTLVCHVGKQ